MQEFHKRLCNVVAVCKGSKEGARKWRTRLGFQLPTLADERGELVSNFDFPPSVWNAARSAVCRDLASQVGAGSQESAVELGADLMTHATQTVYQTGGEIILDCKGKVLLAHKCRSQDDRPSCEDLLALMTKDIEASMTPRGSLSTPAKTRNSSKSKMCCVL